MKKSLIIFGLFSLMMVLTSFTSPIGGGGSKTPETNPISFEIGGEKTPGTNPLNFEIGGEKTPGTNPIAYEIGGSKTPETNP